MAQISQAAKDEVLKTKMAVNPAIWAKRSKIKLPNGVFFSFDDRPYLIEPMSSLAPEICCMKGSGGGFSVSVGAIPSIHGCCYSRYPQGVGNYFPTRDAMQDYVKAVFNPLVQGNPHTIGKYVKAGGKGTDTASLKRIGNSNMFFRGATLTPGEDGQEAAKSISATSIQFDRLVPDETDQMDSEIFVKLVKRMANACVDGIKGKYEIRWIANPSDNDRGIDLFWQSSDQREWFRQCQSCGEWTCAELQFKDNPEKCVGFYPDLLPDGRKKGYIRCIKCEKPVDIAPGKWIPQKPERAKLLGYHWSHLTSHYQNPAKILEDYRNPPQGNLGDIIRLDLGYPYSSTADKLQRSMVLACCGREGMPENHSGPCAIGVDNDDNKHVVVGIRTGNDRYEALKFLRTTTIDFNEVYDLVRRYNIKFGVVDIRPNKDSAVQFQKACASVGCKIFLCEYTDSPLQDANFNDNTGIVKVYRTGIFDTTHRIISNQQIVLPRQSSTVDEFARQCCNCVKSKDERRKDTVIYRYVKTGDQHDHYRNALNYFVIAANRVQRVNRFKSSNRVLTCDNNYRRI